MTNPQPLRYRPWLVVAALLPLAIIAQIAIDVWLGDQAEYYNAANFLSSVASTVTGSDEASTQFLVGQEQLGSPLAHAIGGVLLVAVPAIVLTVTVHPISAIMRRRGAQR